MMITTTSVKNVKALNNKLKSYYHLSNTMACNRCEDIHNAQQCGFTVKGCECLCHELLIKYNPTCIETQDPIFTPPYEVTCDPTLEVNTKVTTCEDGKCTTLNLNI